MPPAGRTLAIISTTAGLIFLLSTLFDTIWWASSHLHLPQDTQILAEGPLTPLKDQPEPLKQAPPPSNTRDISILCAAATLTPQTNQGFKAHVAHIVDGDTLDVYVAGQRNRIRLWGIDAPEQDQPAGPRSHDYLAKLAPPGSTIVVYPLDTDEYDRTVAVAGLPNQPAVNYLMVRQGMAYVSDWPDAQYNDCLDQAKRTALRFNTGIWSQGADAGIRPWHHRNHH